MADAVKAISSYGSTLKLGALTVPVKTIPQMGGEPEMLETTTLDQNIHTYIKGIQQNDSASFTTNYDKDTFSSIKALEDEDSVSVTVIVGDGEGTFTFTGQVSVYVNEISVNSVVEMTITVAIGSEITFA